MGTTPKGGEVRIEVRDTTGCVIISNPAKRNAMTLAMWEAFTAGIAALDADPGVRVIVVQGDGSDAFVSGADISQFEGTRTTVEDQQAYDRTAEDAYNAPGRAGKPVVASIRGICIGGGLGLAAACDIRVCSSDARFRMPAAKLGLGYSVDGVMRFADLVGPMSVLDLFMSARMFGAEEALRMGFVTKVKSPDRLEEEVAELASLIAGNAPLTLRAVKLALRAWHRRDASSIGDARKAVLACAQSGDYLEGQQAFREKRPPIFQGN